MYMYIYVYIYIYIYMHYKAPGQRSLVQVLLHLRRHGQRPDRGPGGHSICNIIIIRYYNIIHYTILYYTIL